MITKELASELYDALIDFGELNVRSKRRFIHLMSEYIPSDYLAHAIRRANHDAD